MSYTDFVTKNIVAPLSMSSSTFSASAAASTGLLAHAHTDAFGPFWGTATKIGYTGGLITSSEDITKWIAMPLNEVVDPVYGRTVVPASVHRNPSHDDCYGVLPDMEHADA